MPCAGNAPVFLAFIVYGNSGQTFISDRAIPLYSAEHDGTDRFK